MCETATGARGAVGRPRWAALYAVTLPQLTVLLAVEGAAPSHAIRTLAECAVAVGTCLVMAWWLRANRAAFDLQRWCECAPGTIRVRVIESPRRAPTEPLGSPGPVVAEPDELVPSDPLVHA
jgi:hypothetical protein